MLRDLFVFSVERRGPTGVPSERKSGRSRPAVYADPRLATSARERPAKPGRSERFAHDAQEHQEEEHQKPLPDGRQVPETPQEVRSFNERF